MLRLTIVSFAIMLVGSTLALLVGRFIPTDMLTTTLTTAPPAGSQFSNDIIGFLLIDLNRHVRVSLPMPVENVIETTMLGAGREVLIQTGIPDRHLYRYSFMTGILHEFNLTYTQPETGEIIDVEDIYRWSIVYDGLWGFLSADRGIYRIDIASNRIEHIISLVDENDSSLLPRDIQQDLMLSPSGTQVALMNHSTIFVFNTDGSDLRQYPNPFDSASSYGYWGGADDRYFYIQEFSVRGATSFFRILDLNSGEIVPATEDLEGYSFSSCWERETWLAYIDVEHDAQLLNYGTGETSSLSSIPELADLSIEDVSWRANCNWLMLEIGDANNYAGMGFEYKPIYLVSQDRQMVYSLGDNVAVIGGIGEDTLFLAEPEGTNAAVYEIHVDNPLQRTRIGSFTPPRTSMNRLWGNPYRMLIYDSNYRPTSVLDIRTGVVEAYFTPDELIGPFYSQWLWN